MNEKTERTVRAAVTLTSPRRPLARGLALLALTFGGALLSACPGSSFTIAADADVDGGPDDGGDGACTGSPSSNPSVLSDNCGVFVAPTGDDGAGAGTRELPYKTLRKAIEAAGEKGAPRVFACGGKYAETDSVVIPGGMELFGSLACPDGSWATGGEKSLIAGLPDKIAVRLQSGGGILLEGFAIAASNAKIAGGSSIAVLAESMSIAELRSCELTAGDGAAGAKGSDGDPTPPVTPMIDDSNKGRPACPKPPDDTTTNPGGIEHVNKCGGTEPESIGGPGGTGFVNQAGNGADGISNPPPENPTGTGGKAETDCGMGGDGKSGTAGADGMPGVPGQGNGVLSETAGFRGVPGGDGAKGRAGQGGGGGGGQKGGSFACNGGSGAGASGGSGGVGGCGGEGGGGGRAGGSSIALVSIDASVTLSDVKLQAGKGGSGGAGGSAQVGGLGATGAMGGGIGSNVTLKVGCMGGDGGPGGKGGPGAGGNGGHSLGIAYYGAVPTGTFDAGTGTPGAGGMGGGSANMGSSGQAKDLLQFNAKE
jgi:hypothetical protein